jgi:hypothetical protein
VGWYLWDNPNVWVMMTADSGLFGYKGNDQYFVARHLKNGWLIEDVQVVCVYPTGGGAGAHLANARIGTDSPYVKVRVWEQPLSGVSDTFSVWIQGPKGVPYE